MEYHIFWIITLAICEVVNLHTMKNNVILGAIPFTLCLIALIMNIVPLVK